MDDQDDQRWRTVGKMSDIFGVIGGPLTVVAVLTFIWNIIKEIDISTSIFIIILVLASFINILLIIIYRLLKNKKHLERILNEEKNNSEILRLELDENSLEISDLKEEINNLKERENHILSILDNTQAESLIYKSIYETTQDIYNEIRGIIENMTKGEDVSLNNKVRDDIIKDFSFFIINKFSELLNENRARNFKYAYLKLNDDNTFTILRHLRIDTDTIRYANSNFTLTSCLAGDSILNAQKLKKYNDYYIYIRDTSNREEVIKAGGRNYDEKMHIDYHKSIICVPIFSDSKPVGVLCIDSIKKDGFIDSDISIIRYLASTIRLIYKIKLLL